MADEMTIQFDGKTYSIDAFELGELEWLEDELGVPLDEINPNSMKAAVRFVYLIKRRDNPDFTLDDARKLKLSVFAEEPPKPAAAAANGRAKRPTKAAA